MKKKLNYLFLVLTCLFIVGCANNEGESSLTVGKTEPKEASSVNKDDQKEKTIPVTTDKPTEKSVTAFVDQKTKKEPEQKASDSFAGHKLIKVDGGNLSGYRESKVVVDIGFGDREYLAFTNEHGQLVRVIADKITLQDDNNEPVTSSGRYYSDEAKVPGVERNDLDEGHIIADSLGGVSNAYNITPQDSTLNRHGDQAYMERSIRDAGGATDFEAIITYPNTTTQIPSRYKYTYTLKGNVIVDEFDNTNPDKVNESLGLTHSKPSKRSAPSKPTKSDTSHDISSVDTNGNGQVTIKEAKDAGFSMPITRDHWLYPYMRDNDGDGMVGE